MHGLEFEHAGTPVECLQASLRTSDKLHSQTSSSTYFVVDYLTDVLDRENIQRGCVLLQLIVPFVASVNRQYCPCHLEVASSSIV